MSTFHRRFRPFHKLLKKKQLSFVYLFYLLLLLVLLMIILVSQRKQNNIQHASASTTDLYVTTTGSDSNPGTQTAPFATINKAASVATPGTIVHVAPGTYTFTQTNGNTPIWTKSSESGTAGNPIIYMSDLKWGAKLVSTYAGAGSIWYNDANYIVITGFDISGSDGSSGITDNGSYVSISDNYIHDIQNSTCIIGPSGITSGGSNIATNVTATGNLIKNIGPQTPCSTTHGIYPTNGNWIVTNNIISNVSGYGISVWHNGANSTIANNTIFSNRYGGIILGGGDSPNYGNSLCDYMVVTNNIVVNNAYYGIREYEYSRQHTIGSHNQILNNNVYGNPSGDMVLIEGNTDSGRVTANAQFVNYQSNGTGDYHLQTTSPDINTGTSTGVPSTDYGGNSRPQGAGFDIGAYEYIVSMPTPTPTSIPVPTPTLTPLPTSTPTPVSTNAQTSTCTQSSTYPHKLIDRSFENTGLGCLSPLEISIFPHASKGDARQYNKRSRGV